MKKKILICLNIIIVLIILMTLFINLYMINLSRGDIIKITDISEYNNFDAILVLGCKVNVDGPSIMLQNRLEKANELYSVLKLKLLLSGDHGSKEYDEVNVMRDYLLKKGVPLNDIFLDHAGFSTYDSIYRAKHVFNAKKIIIITQKYHLYRALYLAKCLDLEAVGVIADDVPYKGIMLKNELREILSRDKNYFKGIFKPKSKYLGEEISLNQDGSVTNG